MPSPISPPTAGALRAAKKLYPTAAEQAELCDESSTKESCAAFISDRARLIDAESGLPELVAALREAKREVFGLRHLARHQLTDTQFRESTEREEKWTALLSKAQTP
jgi:hypothetical protein